MPGGLPVPPPGVCFFGRRKVYHGAEDLAQRRVSVWVRAGRRFVPDPARHKLYADYYRVYRDLYPGTRGQVHALAELGAGG